MASHSSSYLNSFGPSASGSCSTYSPSLLEPHKQTLTQWLLLKYVRLLERVPFSSSRGTMLHLQLQARRCARIGTCRKARPGKHLSSARKAVSAAWPLAGLSWRYSAAYFTCRWAENQ